MRDNRLGLCLLLGIAFCNAPTMAWAQQAATYSFDLPRQPLAESIRAVARQSNTSILFAPEDLDGLVAPPLKGNLSLHDALQLLTAKAGLTADIHAGEPVVIRKGTPKPTQGRAAPPSAPPSAEPSNPPVEEIVVTAQKKSERLQDVPVPVTVLDTDTLAERGLSRLQDYFATVPGLSLARNNSGTSTLSIRGVTTGIVNSPTVGITIDDVPYGSSSILANGSLLVPDIDPGMLAQVEVLRGPQGTLYGASSMGGLVKFVTQNPSTETISGRVEASGNEVEHGGAGYSLRGFVNLPLSDTLAIRVSGFGRRDPGYIENVTTGQHDVNQADNYGGLFSVLWRPSDSVSLKFNALLQNMHGNGSSRVDANNPLTPSLGDLQQARLRGSGIYNDKVRLYTATLNADLGGLDFISISGYGDNYNGSNTDLSRSYAFFAHKFFGVSGTGCSCFNETQKFTQEFRLSSTIGEWLDWVAGAFYTHENSPADQAAIATDPNTGSQVGTISEYNFPTTLSEYALFGDLTIHLTDRFDVQIGGRESWNNQEYKEVDSGPATPAFFGEPTPFVNPTERTNANAFTYLLTPRFKISPDLMVYARLASGYRIGGPNFNASVGQIPIKYAPDTTNNYEVGIKGDLFDHALTLDASAYYIDWSNIQITLLNPVTFFDYTANAGNAKSQGLELSLQARPATGLTVTAAASLNDAELTQNLPAASTAVGLAGARLPYSSPFSGNLTVDQEIPLTDRWTGSVGVSLTYVDARQGEFSTNPAIPRLRFPAYAQTDLYVGLRDESWRFNLFANNLFDKRGIINGANSPAEAAHFYAIYIQPLTVGLTVSKNF